MTPPNIILIITDQQRFDTINALGFPYMDTPNIDRLVNEGVSFDNCHVTAPSCAPARASLFTGYYPHVTGIMRNGDRWRNSWVEDLNSAGYHCVNIGKMHSNPFETPLGFHERYVVENKDRYLQGRYYFDEWDKALQARGLVKQQRELYRQRDDYRERMGAFSWDLPPETHSDNFVGGLAQWWLNTYPRAEPLFLQIGFPGPHPPYDPTPEAAADYIDRDLPLPDVTQAELDGLPPPYLRYRRHNTEVDHDSVVHLLEPSQLQLQRLRAYYAANVTMIDRQLGQIMEALERNGYLQNSVVIFTSDHGDCLGDHGQIQKWTMYDIITRVPAIFWAPGRIAAGQRVGALCQWMDIGRTILELAGVRPVDNMQAVSLLPALKGEPWRGRELVFAEHPADGNYEGPYQTMIRSQRYKLVHFAGEEYGLLFDLETDPAEIDNRWDDEALAAIKRELLQALLNWRLESTLQSRDLFQDHR
ncbi:MAG: sulfatase-like hydrolase/transferase [Chloroflexota bacterium]|nr:sulfatase-like hydrolase/transferase [Chloroflexota bacterium]MDE2945564.1 sulfatase-like hydrolase/transferase [Chloroflexota bacterium]